MKVETTVASATSGITAAIGWAAQANDVLQLIATIVAILSGLAALQFYRKGTRDESKDRKCKRHGKPPRFRRKVFQSDSPKQERGEVRPPKRGGSGDEDDRERRRDHPSGNDGRGDPSGSRRRYIISTMDESKSSDGPGNVLVRRRGSQKKPRG